MKYGLYFVIFLAIFSCSNEFEIIEDYKDIPIVYGLISAIDTAQYIRLERAFVDENTSALEIAQNPDSLYYNNAVVNLVRTSNDDRFPMVRVDGRDEGYPRQDGAFASEPNFLYKIKSSDIQLAEGEKYRLEIERGDNLPLVTAETTLLEASRMLNPGPQTIGLDFNYVLFTTFRWRGGEGAAVYDLFLRINYRERENGGSFERKTALWRIGNNIENTEFEITGVNFYNFLTGAMPAGDQYERRFESVDVILDSGGEEILEFNRIGSANLGITSSQDVPIFTNLSEGRGLFSSKYREEVRGLALSPKSLDSLENGTITGILNFN